MFNKSILAAALLIAGGTTVNAAEIGVRHTWGNSTQTITNGFSITNVKDTAEYSEQSSGFALGINAEEFRAEGGGVEGIYDYSGTDRDLEANPVTFFSETTTRRGRNGNGQNDSQVTVSRQPVVSEESFSTSGEYGGGSLEADGKFAVSGSVFTRNIDGTTRVASESFYDFSGSSTNGFSELSTFSR